MADSVVDARYPVDDLMGAARQIMDHSQYQQVLALRGMLAHGVLFKALTKRNRVDYGVNR